MFLFVLWSAPIFRILEDVLVVDPCSVGRSSSSILLLFSLVLWSIFPFHSLRTVSGSSSGMLYHVHHVLVDLLGNILPVFLCCVLLGLLGHVLVDLLDRVLVDLLDRVLLCRCHAYMLVFLGLG